MMAGITRTQIIDEIKRLPKKEAEEVATFLYEQGIEPTTIRLGFSEKEEEELERRTKDADSGRKMVGPFKSAKEMISHLEGNPQQ